ncbi:MULTISPECIES: HAMP domain-containing protein [unclassified Rhizobacter]|uniref:HAMP domain-containing protein n=1 Tax=unclassified Rhizobacter TaxID=2640088 RepID=UPI0006F56671|nr:MULTISPECIES: HAMP domain-containing protein [unclassified Rhizobacter]KQU77170.1 methanol utilization protein MoxY [Rhizobacter sp. Root29]KQW12756.1 methanol utilization protein MoxY [Rhizobacter sp. Root1238]KRB22344.1 methanol utilization protein MoxY [Rhizobacter sp. Root16D2]
MSLRLKIHLIVGLLTLLFLVVMLGLQLRSMRESVNEEVVAANRVASQFMNRTVWRYAAQGTPAVLGFLQGMGRVRSNDITLLDKQGTVLYTSPSSPYKPGRDAPDWFDALVAPPPAVQSLELPDGRLTVQANASRAVLDAWDEAIVLVFGAVVTLVVLNGLVYWLVGHTVRPFGRIVAALNQLEAGRFDVVLPPLPGAEAGTIGKAFNRMVGMLQGHIETERRAVRAELQLSESRELTRWVDHQIEQERHLIARELHDELGQSVTAMRSMALSIAQRMRALDPQAEQAARLIAEEASRLYDAMHGIIPRLTPLVLDTFGLADALADLAERTRRSHPGARIELQADLAGVPLGSEAALALYRAAQEGLTNALRHGQAQRVDVRLQALADGVLLELVDDGAGLAADWADKKGHHGLRWLAERVQGLGGSFELLPHSPRGVRLAVRLPGPVPRTEAVPE